MNATVDHVFVCCSVGGPEGEALVRAGFEEGPPNRHPGQGTACRRFVFANAYLELFWVSDPQEAQSPAALPTRLWDRWSRRAAGACPFGIILRPAPGTASDAPPPFPTWRYAPQYMPPGMAIEVAEGTRLAEPALFYLGFQRGPALARPDDQNRPKKSLTNVTVLGPVGALSEASQALQAAGLVSFSNADEYAMELQFDGADRGHADLRPALPLSLHW